MAKEPTIDVAQITTQEFLKHLLEILASTVGSITPLLEWEETQIGVGEAYRSEHTITPSYACYLVHNSGDGPFWFACVGQSKILPCMQTKEGAMALCELHHLLLSKGM